MQMKRLFLAGLAIFALWGSAAHAQIVWSVANEGTTGTTVGLLAKITGAPSTAVKAATTDTGGMFGVVSGETLTATTGNALITVYGPATCTFDGATTAGNYFTISSTTAGDCHDTGSTTQPTASQSIGKVTQTIGGAGSASVFVFSPGINIGTLLNSASVWKAAQRGTVTNITIATSTFTPNFDTAQNFEVDLTSACPCTLANPSTTLVAGQSGMFEVHQDGTGSRTIGTWGSAYQAVGGTAAITLSSAASTITYLPYYVNNAATGIVLGAPLSNPAH